MGSTPPEPAPLSAPGAWAQECPFGVRPPTGSTLWVGIPPDAFSGSAFAPSRCGSMPAAYQLCPALDVLSAMALPGSAPEPACPKPLGVGHVGQVGGVGGGQVPQGVSWRGTANRTRDSRGCKATTE